MSPLQIYIYLSLILGICAYTTSGFFPVLTAFASICILLYFLKKTGKHAVVLMLLFIFGFYYGALKHDPSPNLQETTPPRETLFSGTIAGMPIETEYGYLEPFSLSNPPLKGDVFINFPKPLEPGTFIEGNARVTLKAGHLNPGMYSGNASLFLKPLGAVTLSRDNSPRFIPDRLRWMLYSRFNEAFSGETAGFLSALIIGHHRYSDRLYRDYARVGLAHLMSISGTHFGLFTILVFSFIRFSARALPYRWLIRLTGRISIDELATLLTLPLIVFYLLLSGARIPALRSFIMINIFLLGLLIGRKGQWLYSLLFALTVILLMDPSSAFTPSFQLSFAAVLSIGLTLEFAENRLPLNRIGPFTGTLLKILLVTIGASAGTMPLVLYYFHRLPALGIATNMVFTPLICFLILPAGIIGSLCYLLTGVFPLGGLFALLISKINQGVSFLSSLKMISFTLPGFSAGVLILIYATAGCMIMRKRKASLICFSVLAFTVIYTLPSYLAPGPRIVFLDVGQGDAAVVETSDGKTVVIDTGHTGREVIGYLRYRGIGKIDALVLSHAGRDHAGGLWNILDEFRVGEIWDNGLLTYQPAIENTVVHRQLKAGDILKTGSAGFLVLHPRKGYYNTFGDDENNQSLVLRYTDRDISILFTGDIEADGELSLLRLPKYLGSRVLKVSHHGSYTSSKRVFLASVNPGYAIISAGRFNPYGHPHRGTLRNLKGIQLHRTDREGAIEVSSHDSGEISISSYADHKLKETAGLNLMAELENIKRLFLLW